MKHLVLFLFSFGLTIISQGQQLVVNLLNGQTEQYPVSEIQSIKFPTNSMVLYENNGNITSWNIADIFNYEFDMSSLSTEFEDNESGALKIYPNPTSDQVQIEYSGSKSDNLTIEILHSDGRKLAVLYQGNHTERTSIRWDVRSESISPGAYLCRVASDTKVITGKIIVQ